MADSDTRYSAMSAISALISRNLIVSDQVPMLLPLLEKCIADSNSWTLLSAMPAISSLVDKKMITQSELEDLKNVATDDSVKEKLEELQSRAPVSIQRKAVEAKVKTKVKLSKNQRREIIERMKKQRQMEAQQEQLRQEKQSEHYAKTQRENPIQEHDFDSYAGAR